MKEINCLLRNRDVEFSLSPYSIDVAKFRILDAFYLAFIRDYNGGFFFSKSLLIYGHLGQREIYSLDTINEKINLAYGIMSANNFFFACDIFANQFCFDLLTGKIYFFALESGEKKFVANNFVEWVQIIESDTDCYTGQSFIIKWEEVMSPLNYDERLTAKIPFVLGGEYQLSNCRVEKLDNILEFNSSIAKQVSDLPDGTIIRYKLE